MARRQKEPLRGLAGEERRELERVSRSAVDTADRVAKAKILLAVSGGARLTDAARAAGRRSGQAAAHLVWRFNKEGLPALDRKHGGGQPKAYNQVEEERILQEARRQPDRETDGTATWSLSTLQRALRNAPDGLPTVSTYVIWCVLHEAGYSWQLDRSWCKTGQAVRKRKAGPVVVHDPDAVPKKS